MNKVEEKKISLFKRFSNFFFEEDNTNARKKIFSSLWALFFGMIIASIFIASLGSNPFEIYYQIINSSLKEEFIYRFLITISVFIFASVAVGVGFKASMFNIGIPGQMMASGLVCFVVVSYLGSTSNTEIVVKGWHLIVGLLAGLVAAVFVGMIAGLLKAFFNINEVISTILLNWIIYYIAYQLLVGKIQGLPFTLPPGLTDLPISKKIIFENDFFNSQAFAGILLGLSFIFAITVWFIIKKTPIGYKIKMTGFNKNASKYSGTNEKLLIISILSVSAVLAGIAGFLWFVFSRQNLPILSSPEPLGFDAIAVSLLAYNSPIGIIFTAIFYSLLTVGSDNIQILNPKLDAQAVQMISGLIIYFAAIAVIFFKFKPVSKFIKFVFLVKSHYFYHENRKIYEYKQLRSKIKKQIKNKNNSSETIELWSKRLEILNDYIKHLQNLHKEKPYVFKKAKAEYIQEFINFKNNNPLSKNATINEYIKHLEKELLINTRFLNKLSNLSKEHKISIFKAYWFSKKIMRKNNKLSVKIIELTNEPNKIQWKVLQNELKSDFFKKAMNQKDINEEQKIELFRELSEKRREINKQLSELGFYDLKVLKDQYKANRVELKAQYTKEKDLIVQNMKNEHKWIRIEVI
ncbi:ABC transporter permease subunit [Mycoplasma sp. 5370]